MEQEKIIDGTILAEKIKTEVKTQLKSLTRRLVLVAVQVGENPASRVYITNQKKSCEECDVEYRLDQLPTEISQDNLIEHIEMLNRDMNVTGIILQMPVPAHINAREVQTYISPQKDVEGIHPMNLGLLVYGRAKVVPCTPLAVYELIKFAGIDIKGKDITIVGHSEIVGKPLALLLLSSPTESATPTVCHIATRDLASHTRRADILIVAVGKAGLIKGDMVKDGAVVIDVGINRVPVVDKDGQPVLDEKGKPKMKTVGDVVFEEVIGKVSKITPVPGGVGPVTVAMLLRNLMMLAK